MNHRRRGTGSYADPVAEHHTADDLSEQIGFDDAKRRGVWIGALSPGQHDLGVAEKRTSFIVTSGRITIGPKTRQPFEAAYVFGAGERMLVSCTQPASYIYLIGID